LSPDAFRAYCAGLWAWVWATVSVLKMATPLKAFTILVPVRVPWALFTGTRSTVIWPVKLGTMLLTGSMAATPKPGCPGKGWGPTRLMRTPAVVLAGWLRRTSFVTGPGPRLMGLELAAIVVAKLSVPADRMKLLPTKVM